MNKLSIVVPVFNEEGSLRQLHKEIVESVKGLNAGCEFIFVDDGSTDNSFRILKEIHDQDRTVKVIQFRKNYGKAAALSTGFQEAGGDIIATMDADLQDAPAEIPNFIKEIEKGYDLVSGWKFMRKDPLGRKIASNPTSADLPFINIHYRRGDIFLNQNVLPTLFQALPSESQMKTGEVRKLGSKIFNKATSLLTGIKIHDFNCGFKAYRKEVTEDIKVYGELHRYLPVLAHWGGYRIGEIKVKHHPENMVGQNMVYLAIFMDFLIYSMAAGEAVANYVQDFALEYRKSDGTVLTAPVLAAEPPNIHLISSRVTHYF